MYRVLSTVVHRHTAPDDRQRVRNDRDLNGIETILWKHNNRNPRRCAFMQSFQFRRLTDRQCAGVVHVVHQRQPFFFRYAMEQLRAGRHRRSRTYFLREE